MYSSEENMYLESEDTAQYELKLHVFFRGLCLPSKNLHQPQTSTKSHTNHILVLFTRNVYQGNCHLLVFQNSCAEECQCWLLPRESLRQHYNLQYNFIHVNFHTQKKQMVQRLLLLND